MEYQGTRIENITPVEAYCRGYLTLTELYACQQWKIQDLSSRRNNTLVYINGKYCGTAKKYTKMNDIIDRFKKKLITVSVSD